LHGAAPALQRVGQALAENPALAAYVRQDLPTAPAVIPKLPTGGSGGLMPGIDPSSNRSFSEAMDADMNIPKLR